VLGPRQGRPLTGLVSAAAPSAGTPDHVGAGPRALVRLLSDRAEAEPASIALRVKRLGLWEQVTWAALARRVRDLALGLAAAGVKAGDCVGLIAEATPEALAVDLACQAVGALSLPIDPFSALADVRHLLDLGGARFLAVGDLETLDRLRTAPELDGAPVRTAVLLDGSIIRTVRDWKLLTLKELESLGQETVGGGTLADLAGGRSAEEPMSLHATAGTQGQPRLTPISSANLVAAWDEFLDTFRPSRADSFVVEAALSHVTGRAAILLLPLLYGAIAHFPEHPAAVDEAMADVVPTLSIALPQRWEARAAAFRSRMAEAGPVHRLAYRSALGARRRAVTAAAEGKPLSALARFGAVAGRALVLRPMLTKAGLHRLRAAAVGGRYLAPELLLYWHSLGVPLTVFYGATEAAGVIAYQPSPSVRLALKPFRSRPVRLTKGDEIEVQLHSAARPLAHPWNGEAAAAQAEHWFATGDRGELTESGEVLLSYRLSEIVSIDGREVPIGEVERLLLAQGHIKHVAVIGRNRPYLTALVDLDLASVAAWARANSVRYGSLEGLAVEPRVIDLVADAVEAANLDLAARELPPVKEFAVVRAGEAFELTDVLALTGEIRRAEVEKRYSAIVESLYSGGHRSGRKVETGSNGG
jgi:long-chain acyl-CoA synthetase